MFVHVIRFVWEGPGVDSFVALQFQTGLGLDGGVFFCWSSPVILWQELHSFSGLVEVAFLLYSPSAVFVTRTINSVLFLKVQREQDSEFSKEDFRGKLYFSNFKGQVQFCALLKGLLHDKVVGCYFMAFGYNGSVLFVSFLETNEFRRCIKE